MFSLIPALKRGVNFLAAAEKRRGEGILREIGRLSFR
jgi:hypothetical protein